MILQIENSEIKKYWAEDRPLWRYKVSALFVFESVLKVRNDVIVKGFPHLEDCNSSGLVMKQRKERLFFGLQLL